MFSLCVSGFFVGAVNAHHSLAEYDNDTFVEAVGTVVDVVWRNPHVLITVVGTDAGRGPLSQRLKRMASRPGGGTMLPVAGLLKMVCS